MDEIKKSISKRKPCGTIGWIQEHFQFAGCKPRIWISFIHDCPESGLQTEKRDQCGRTENRQKTKKKIPGRSWLFTVILVYSTLKLVTIFRYWWHNFDIGGIFWMFVPGSPALKSHKAITKLVTPTQFVSNNRHQHRCNQNSVYRQFSRIIDVTLEENIFEEKWPGAWLSINIVNVLQ